MEKQESLQEVTNISDNDKQRKAVARIFEKATTNDDTENKKNEFTATVDSDKQAGYGIFTPTQTKPEQSAFRQFCASLIFEEPETPSAPESPQQLAEKFEDTESLCLCENKPSSLLDELISLLTNMEASPVVTKPDTPTKKQGKPFEVVYCTYINEKKTPEPLDKESETSLSESVLKSTEIIMGIERLGRPSRIETTKEIISQKTEGTVDMIRETKLNVSYETEKDIEVSPMKYQKQNPSSGEIISEEDRTEEGFEYIIPDPECEVIMSDETDSSDVHDTYSQIIQYYKMKNEMQYFTQTDRKSAVQLEELDAISAKLEQCAAERNNCITQQTVIREVIEQHKQRLNDLELRLNVEREKQKFIRRQMKIHKEKEILLMKMREEMEKQINYARKLTDLSMELKETRLKDIEQSIDDDQGPRSKDFW